MTIKIYIFLGSLQLLWENDKNLKKIYIVTNNCYCMFISLHLDDINVDVIKITANKPITIIVPFF